MTSNSTGASAPDPVRRLKELIWEMQVLVAHLDIPEPQAPARPKNQHKLTKTEVQAIRDLARQGIPYRDIARTFAVHHTTVSRTVKGTYHRKGSQ